MAAWHYRCSLVPKNSIVQYYRNLGWEAPLNDDYIGCTVDYFEIEISKQFTDKIKLCFAQYYPFVEIWDGGVFHLKILRIAKSKYFQIVSSAN